MVGMTSTSAVKTSCSPSAKLVTSTAGWPSTCSSLLAHGVAVEARDGVVDGLLEHDTATDPLVEHGGGHLARAEARGCGPAAPTLR